MSDADLFTDTPAPSGGDLFTDEPAPKSYGEDVLHNAGQELINFPKSIPTMANQALDFVSAPMDALKAVPQLLEGKNLSDTDIAQDIKPIIEGNKNTVSTIAHPVESFRKAPINTALTAAALFGTAKGMMPEAKTVPKPAPKVPEMPPAAPGGEGLKVIEPGAKTGDPHALFAYNDQFGPGGKPRSVYNVYGDPNNPAIQERGWGSSVPKEELDKANIPVTGRTPTSQNFEPLDKLNAAISKVEPMVQKAGDLTKEVKDYVNSKYSQAAGKASFPERLAKILQEESNALGAKDIGLQGRQIKTMGEGFKGIEKANQLVQYAREKGYLDPSLTDVARREKIVQAMEKAGQNVDAVRAIADKRGAPPIDAIKAAVKQELETTYGGGVEKAPTEIKNVMEDIEKASPTFKGMADLASKLNKSATKVKDLGQHPGPTTDAANIVSRLNNEAIRGVLNPEEATMYSESLRDYGANKKLEQATAAAARGKMTARSNQRGILGRLYQEVLDRGGYRLGGNIANKTAEAILKNPGKTRTLPQFFEELAHQADTSIDDAIAGMYKGGTVPDDVKRYVSGRC